MWNKGRKNNFKETVIKIVRFRYSVFKDHITLRDCIFLFILDEINDGMSIDLYYA